MGLEMTGMRIEVWSFLEILIQKVRRDCFDNGFRTENLLNFATGVCFRPDA